MTDSELDKIEDLWRQGVSTYDIADELGYCPGTIIYWTRKDRTRFPPRRRFVKDEKKLELWCYRIIGGRATVEEVARLFDVDERTVMKRLRRCRSQIG